MKNTHTPGPWKINTKGSRHFIDAGDGLSVAVIDREGARGKRAENEANAHLVAAAPELLASMRAILEMTTAALCYFDSTHPAFTLIKGTHVAARAAIAKAEGRA